MDISVIKIADLVYPEYLKKWMYFMEGIHEEIFSFSDSDVSMGVGRGRFCYVRVLIY